jgi:glycosyltransferase involved in cell wall biosynthesis
VCICTYKRPELLDKLLSNLEKQETENLFNYSVVVVDNDKFESARETVQSHAGLLKIDIKYVVEPEQNIALARNKAVESANGDFIAFIDDDEFPEQDWLVNLYGAACKFRADGILGPVKPYFESPPPSWVIRGRLCERESFRTGEIIQKVKYTRTGNVLLDKRLFADNKSPFDSLLGKSGGEDIDFFSRMMRKGHKFVWCNEAIVSEIFPRERLQRLYFVKRAFLQGVVSSRNLTLFSAWTIKSVTASIIYSAALPVLLLVRHDLFMQYLIKDCNHIGRVLALFGVKILKERTW